MCSEPIFPRFSTLALVSPLPQLMVHSLHGLFALQGSQCCLPLQCTKLFLSPHCVARAILCSMQKWANCPSVLFCINFCHLVPKLASLIFIPSWTQFLQFLSEALVNIWTNRARQRNCITSGNPQFFISSPQISLITNFHIAHTLKDLSPLPPIQLTNASTLPWELFYSSCSFPVYAPLIP